MATKNSAVSIGKKFVDKLSPDAQAEKLVFRRFPGEMLQKAAVYGSKIDETKIDKIVLKINPRNVQFAKRKVIQKVQTSSPNRFIVFDWGHELTVLTIEGVTGNLLPDSLTKGVLDPVADAIVDVLSFSPENQASLTGSDAWKTIQKIKPSINAKFNDLMLGNLTYSEILELSTKYKTFKRLEKIYDISDSDNDIITLELGDTIYRGFFEEFTFNISAESPWNWVYNMVFVILSNLSEVISRLDDNYKDIDSKTEKE